MPKISTLRSSLRQSILVMATAGIVAVSMAAMTTPVLAQSGGDQCQLRTLAANIKSAVLALKATRYCRGFDLPYTRDEVTARIDDLRCGSQSSALIDDLLDNYEIQYKTIMKTDARQVVCNQATTIHF